MQSLKTCQRLLVLARNLSLIFALFSAATSTAGSATWNTNGTNILYSAGNIGIGTSAPQEMLEVTGNMRKDFVSSSTNTPSYWQMIGNDGAGNWNEYLNSTGTTTPTSVTDGAGFRREFSPGKVGGANVYYQQYATPVTGGSAQTWKDYIEVDATNGILGLMDGGGNVGIGTSVPDAQLQVFNPSGKTQVTIGGHASTGGYTFLRMGTSALSGGYNQIQSIQSSGTAWGVLALNQSGGNVGIGTSAPQYELDVNGIARVSQLVYSSDARLKSEVTPISQSLEKILSLTGVTYRWNETAHKRGLTDPRTQVGLIAQEVEKVVPEAVQTAEDGFKSVNYPALVGPIVQSIKEFYSRYLEKTAQHERQIADQKQDISMLQAENKELRKRLDDIQKRMEIKLGAL